MLLKLLAGLVGGGQYADAAAAGAELGGGFMTVLTGVVGFFAGRGVPDHRSAGRTRARGGGDPRG